MKKVVCLMIALVLCFAMAAPAFAAEDDFTPSVSYKDGPVVISARMDAETMRECIVVTSITQAKNKSTDITQEERDQLLWVYEELKNGNMDLPLKNGYVIRDLIDINFLYEGCRTQNSHNEKDVELAKPDKKITIVLDMDIAEDVRLEVLQYKNDTWSYVDEVTNNGDGTITLVFEHFCPVAFVVYDGGTSDVPQTGDAIGRNLGLWIGLMVVAAAALVVVVAVSRKKK